MENEIGSLWHLGQHALYEGHCVEVTGIDTSVDVLWEQGEKQLALPARSLLFGALGPHGVLPNDIVADSGAHEQYRFGSVVAVDPTSRMATVDWGEQSSEHSMFDLEVQRHLCFRCYDIVIRVGDPVRPDSALGGGWPAGLEHESGAGEWTVEQMHTRCGQVVAVRRGACEVKWLDGSTSTEAPQSLHMLITDNEYDEMDPQQLQPTPLPDHEQLVWDQLADWWHAAVLGLLQPWALIWGWLTALLASGQHPVHELPAADPEQATEPEPVPEPAAEPEQSWEAGMANSSQSEPEEQFELLPEVCEGHLLAEGGQRPEAGDWVKSANREWRILRKGLPDQLYVRAFEDRMDLLRAYVPGASKTPYEGGLFVFDIGLSADFPNSAPSVLFWSFGRSINPNLYENGKVCLSLLNTWRGRAEQMWSPGKSTLLQVLVSIQSLILVPEPYFNEPGLEAERGTPEGTQSSALYNESARVLTLQIMLQTLTDPVLRQDPVVQQHFRSHAKALVEACQADSLDENFSEGFRSSMARLLPELRKTLEESLDIH